MTTNETIKCSHCGAVCDMARGIDMVHDDSCPAARTYTNVLRPGEDTTKHTPGPLHTDILAILDSEGGAVGGAAGPELIKGEWQGGDGRLNARLFAAAYTSYDKHCGPRAVECAEADLLGEALKALADCDTEMYTMHTYWHPKCDSGCPAGIAHQAAQVVLAKAAGTKH